MTKKSLLIAKYCIVCKIQCNVCQLCTNIFNVKRAEIVTTFGLKFGHAMQI